MAAEGSKGKGEKNSIKKPNKGAKKSSIDKEDKKEYQKHGKDKAW